jgi:hypothetical protein
MYCTNTVYISLKLVRHFKLMFIDSFHWHVQNATIPCRSVELLPFLAVIPFALSPFSLYYSPILALSCHVFLGLLLNLVSKFIYNTILGILFSSILCTWPNHCNIFICVIVGF